MVAPAQSNARLKTHTGLNTAMEEAPSYVLVFPTVFARKRIPQLTANIKTILRIRGQEFRSVGRDGDIILVHANDPVFASSAIGLLFGVRRVAIARRAGNGLDELVSKIASVGGNLLLRGERFLVTVEGTTKGFIAKDAEVAATSKIIERKEELGAVPGTESRFDKEIYAYVTPKNAYVCIFSDGGAGGVPTQRDGRKDAACAVYDELSAASCFECMRQGYDVSITVFYKSRAGLLNLARLLNRLIPRMLRQEVELEFVRMGGSISSAGKKYQDFVGAVTRTMHNLQGPGARMALAVPPAAFPADVVDAHVLYVTEHGMTPLVPLAGTGEDGIYGIARELVLGDAGVKRLEKEIATAATPVAAPSGGAVRAGWQDDAVRAEPVQKVAVRVGANNTHDILDSLYPGSSGSSRGTRQITI